MKEVLDDIERWRARATASRSPRRRARRVGPPRPGRDDGGQRRRRGRGLRLRRLRRGRGRHRGARGAGRRAGARRRDASGTPTTRRSRSGSPAAERSTSSSSHSTGELMTAEPAPIYEALRDALRAERPVALATVTRGPGLGAKLLVRPDQPALGTLGDADLDRVVARDALGELELGLDVDPPLRAHGEARERRTSRCSSSRSRPPPRMVIFGAVDFTAALARAGKLLGYRVTVCDARAVFATPGAVPDGRRGRQRLARPLPREGRPRRSGRATPCACSPTTRSSTCPRSSARSQTRVGYLGAMGSRRTHAERVERLREAGVDDAGLGSGDGADRPRHRRAHARGDGDRHLRRDHRPTDRAARSVAARRRRPDPSAPARSGLTMPEADVAPTSPSADGPERDLGRPPALRPGLLLAPLRRRTTGWRRSCCSRSSAHRLGRRLDRPALRPGERPRQGPRPDRRPPAAPHRRGRAHDRRQRAGRGRRPRARPRAVVAQRRSRSPPPARGASTSSGSAKRERSRIMFAFPGFLCAQTYATRARDTTSSVATWAFAIAGLVLSYSRPRPLRAARTARRCARARPTRRGATTAEVPA